MRNENWYRRKTWTPTDQQEFFARLQRSRGAFHKAQYARIQAYELQCVGTHEAMLGAVELLDMILAEWRSDAQLAMVHSQYADCFLYFGQRDKAIESFREVFRVQRQRCGETTLAQLDFGWLCISVPLPQFYSEVMGVLDEFKVLPIYRVPVYCDAAIRAIIHHSRGEHPLARVFAQYALEAAGTAQARLTRHPPYGVGTATDQDIYERLQSIAV